MISLYKKKRAFLRPMHITRFIMLPATYCGIFLVHGTPSFIEYMKLYILSSIANITILAAHLLQNILNGNHREDSGLDEWGVVIVPNI